MSDGASGSSDDKVLTGIVLMLVAYLVFSCIDTSSKWLSLVGLSPLQVAFMRYFGHFAVSLGYLGRGKVALRCPTPRLTFLVLLRGVFLAGSTIFNFIAIQYLQLSLTASILFTAPILICALSWPLLREPVGIYRWSAIAFGFCGVLIAIRPFGQDFHWAVFLSLGAALSFAFYSILTRMLADTVETDTMQFYSGLVGTVGLLPSAILLWQMPETAVQWALLLAIGLFGWGGHQMLTTAMRYAPANVLMPYGYSMILYMTFWGYVVFGNVPDAWAVVGAIIIVAAGLVIWFRERKLAVERRKQMPISHAEPPPQGAQ